VRPERSESRRSAAARANLERIADLERQLAERDPEQVKQTVRAELEAERGREAERSARAALDAQTQEAADLYERLIATPDAELTAEQYEWREQRKALLKAYPSVEAHHKAAYDQKGRRFLEAQRQHLAEQLGRLSERPGVDREVFKSLPTFGELGEHLYEAGRRSRDPELKRAQDRIRALEGDTSQYRLTGGRGLGAARGAIAARGGGRSSGGSPGRPDFKTASASDLFAAAIRQSADGTE
jgi:hypothetical protein